MTYDQKCTRCGSILKKIPIKKLDSTLIIELYCENCDESVTYYPDVNKIKLERPSIF